ncbi:MAG: endonuclease/exonuclease/phosphatase family protein [Bacteroidaceae bacterium]|nr:endonuclease/exonuclease/phosphatase family protein [Bacteroidaceae bacterium]
MKEQETVSFGCPLNVFLRKAFLLVASLLITAPVAFSQQFSVTSVEEEGVHRFATFNVRYCNPSNGDTGDKLWANRRTYVGRIVTDYDFDIVGMQEVVGNNRDSKTGKSQLQDLRDMLPDYADWAVEREGRQYQYNVVFYKRAKYELLDKGKLYLNEHPATPGAGWSGDSDPMPRAMAWVRLRDKASGREFFFAVVHNNHGAAVSGIEGCRLVGSYLRELAGESPVILVGDFNMRRNDHHEAWRGVGAVLSDAALHTTTTCLPKGNITHTASNWLPATDEGCKGSEFDYVFYKHLRPLSRHIITEDYERGIAPSDHFPLLVRFRFLADEEQALPTDANGTYQISTAQDLLRFSSLVADFDHTADARLTQDIDMSGLTQSWVPIGRSDVPYSGNFDGGGHQITGFTYTTKSQDAGLFGYCAGGTIGHFSLGGRLTCLHRMSGVVGRTLGTTLSDISSALTISATQSGLSHVGGIVGSAQNTTLVERCAFSGSLDVGPSNYDCFGGICGYTNTARFNDCANYGRVSFSKNDCYAGGILGYVNNGNFPGLHNCLNVGRVRYTGSGSSQYGGALVGRLRSYNAAQMGQSFWLSSSASHGSGENQIDAFRSATVTQMKSGEVCYLLNDAEQENPVWFQTLGTDSYPMLDNSHLVVLKDEEGRYYNEGNSIRPLDDKADQQASVAVYDLQGRTIFRNVKRENPLSSLPKGLYIIGGKAVISP